MPVAPENYVENIRNGPGLVLATIGIVSVALTLTVAGYGFPCLAALCGIVAGLCLYSGISLIVAEQRRAVRSTGRNKRN